MIFFCITLIYNLYLLPQKERLLTCNCSTTITKKIKVAVMAAALLGYGAVIIHVEKIRFAVKT